MLCTRLRSICVNSWLVAHADAAQQSANAILMKVPFPDTSCKIRRIGPWQPRRRRLRTRLERTAVLRTASAGGSGSQIDSTDGAVCAMGAMGRQRCAVGARGPLPCARTRLSSGLLGESCSFSTSSAQGSSPPWAFAPATPARRHVGAARPQPARHRQLLSAARRNNSLRYRPRAPALQWLRGRSRSMARFRRWWRLVE
jgi:hypothetical protein